MIYNEFLVFLIVLFLGAACNSIPRIPDEEYYKDPLEQSEEEAKCRKHELKMEIEDKRMSMEQEMKRNCSHTLL